MSKELYGFVQRRVYETHLTLVCQVGDQLNLAVQYMLDRIHDSTKAEEILELVAKHEFGNAIMKFNVSQDHTRITYGTEYYQAAADDASLAVLARNTLENLDGP